ncbi:GNAT family N-acetyltransferase [Candidatus Woesearchaeota archaeon]|nr:GNAT family N-acetyltransferase [Candidatus Woesearchaeota archaeon]
MIKMTHAKPNELKTLTLLLKNFYPIHNIFKKPGKEIEKYTKGLEGTWVLAKDMKKKGKIIGCCFVGKKGSLWRIKHLAVEDAYLHHGVEESILAYAEQTLIKKGKVEIHISENEKLDVEFYENAGYDITDRVPGYHRKDEVCFFLQKTITSLEKP